jgi:hypothetical protein
MTSAGVDTDVEVTVATEATSEATVDKAVSAEHSRHLAEINGSQAKMVVKQEATMVTLEDAWCFVCRGCSPAERSMRAYCSPPCRQRVDRGRRREAA